MGRGQVRKHVSERIDMSDTDQEWYRTAMEAWDHYKNLTIKSAQQWYAGNKDYSRMIALDAMGALDESYAETGVRWWNDEAENDYTCSRWQEIGYPK